MHVGLIAANTSTVQSVHVRTHASYALLSFLMVLGAYTSTPGTQPITRCIPPCNRDVCINYIIYLSHILQWGPQSYRGKLLRRGQIYTNCA